MNENRYKIDDKFQNNDKLEIYLITYNRKANLDNTLSQWKNSIFKDFKITILDNNSDVDNFKVYNSYKKDLTSLKYIKHKCNIGLGGNILRAVELSESEYTWIICDDDNFNFTYCNDVVEVINHGVSDLLVVGFNSLLDWNKGGKTYKISELLEENFPIFILSSFLPAIIFKTNDYKNHVSICYNNVNNALPQMIYYFSKFNDPNTKLYFSKSKIVNHSNLATDVFKLEKLLKWWINTCVQNPNKTFREKALFTFMHNKSETYFLIFMSYFLISKKFTLIEYYNIFSSLRILNKILFFFFILISYATIFIPIPFYNNKANTLKISTLYRHFKIK